MQRITCSLLAATLLFLGTAASSKEDTEALDPKYTWDLTEIYPTVEAWEQARDEAMQDFEKIEERRGTLGDSADSLYTAMQMIVDMAKPEPYRAVVTNMNAIMDELESLLEQRDN